MLIEIEGLRSPYAENQTLFPMEQRCHRCQDIGFNVENGRLVECSRAVNGLQHNSPTPAAVVLRRSIVRLMREGLQIDTHHFLVAKKLTEFTSEKPCDTRNLLETYFSFAKDPLRVFARTVETLRSVWLLPVGSRRGQPAGYWIITELDDFAAWVNIAKAAPITQLTTIHRVARANFPHFAEQLELEFFNDIASREDDR